MHTPTAGSLTPLKLPRGSIFMVGLTGMLMSLPGQTNGVSPFTDYLIDAVHIARDQLSLAYFFGTLTSALVLPHAGKLYDRWGSRITGSAAAAGLGLSLLLLTRLPSFIRVIASTGIPDPLAAMLSFWIGFFLIRFFGQGMLTLVSRNMILKWFDDRRGFANALIGIGLPLGFSAAPLLLNAVIQRMGWQSAWLVLGIVLFPFFSIVALLLYSDPEPQPAEKHSGVFSGASQQHTGRVPGILVPVARIMRRAGLRRTSEPMRPHTDWSLRSAQKTIAFWVFVLVTMLSGMLVTGLTFHIVAIMGESGVGREQALAIFLPTAVIAVAVHALGSIGSDFVSLKYFAVAHAAALGMLLVSLQMLTITPAAYWLVVIFQGLSLGLFGVNSAVVWPRFFGLVHLGAISGFSNSFMVAGSALGPYTFSLMERVTGSFYSLLYVMGPVCLLLAVLSFKADNPNRQ